VRRHLPIVLLIAANLLWGSAWVVAKLALADWSPLQVSALAFLALGCTVAAYWVWFYALESLEAGAAALTIFIQPVWGALLAAWLLDEPWSAATAAGGALVLLSLSLALGPGNDGARWTAVRTSGPR
jgi:drug/metabolite transporter (DMT)-like permease